MKHYGLGDKGTMAVAMALMVNRKINTVNMQGNNIGPGGMLYLEKMMCSNSNITELSLSDNNLGNFGATAIQSILTDNRTLSRLELAGVNFTDADAAYIAKVVQESPNLLYLDLSHNDFGDLSGDLFTEMIAENGALQELNLSWNKFRKTGAKKVARGLKDNAYLKVLNFAWNGIDDDGGIAFGKALKANEVLNTLDLTCTRIGPAGFMAIIESIGLNESLTTLKIGKNSIPEDAATAALQILRSYGTLRLETLDMTDVTFSSKFASDLESLREMHHNVNVMYGYSENYGKNKMNTQDILEEGMAALREYCTENGVSLVDLFSRFDTDNSMTITLEEFQEGLKDTDLPLSLYKMELFAQALDKDGDGEIDYSELVLYSKKWPWHTNGNSGVFKSSDL
ncbi:hypothetical protein CHS0354_027646 [Potamilus streckersoni]|nr:hypothetical protein CHS0354_027646 [Potamilus streckersoni]